MWDRAVLGVVEVANVRRFLIDRVAMGVAVHASHDDQCKHKPIRDAPCTISWGSVGVLKVPCTGTSWLVALGSGMPINAASGRLKTHRLPFATIGTHVRPHFNA